MTPAGYRVFEHTADLGIEAWGPSREEAFAAAARGLFAQLCDPAVVAEDTEVTLAARGADDEERLVHFLQEALYPWHARRLLLVRFAVRITGETVTATARGEAYDPARHEIQGELKAVTYHGARVVGPGDPASPGDPPGWRVAFVVDI